VDLDVHELEVVRRLPLSDSSDLAPRLRGCAALFGRGRAALAVTGGVHTALDVVKATMAGANATQMVSALLRNGSRHLRKVRADLEQWLPRDRGGGAAHAGGGKRDTRPSPHPPP